MESVKKWLNERNTKKNGVFVHYSPPKLVTAGKARHWARLGAECKLERLVLAGRGRRLLAQLDRLPAQRHLTALLDKCEALHAAVERGSLCELQELLQSEYNKRKLVMCLDEAGAGLLHKAVYFDYMDIAEWLVKNFPQLVDERDSLGRTPLHYAACCRRPGQAAALLEGAGGARGVRDAAGHTPAHYRAAAADTLALPTTDMPTDGARNPPGLVIKRHNIRIWCHDCDMARLQRVVWEGHGKALLSEVSNQPIVKRFLEAVPYIMNTIRDIHKAVIENDLEGLMKFSGDPVPPQILSSRDANNMTVMHKAAGLGHGGILGYIAERYPQGINDIDNDGRTPLHYAAAVRDDQHVYNTLVSLGADEGIMDNKNKPPGYYINKPHEIDKNLLRTLPDAPRTPSSAYPPSWDWKILDIEANIEVHKKGKKKAKGRDNSTSKNITNSRSEDASYQRVMKVSNTQENVNELPDDDKLTKQNADINIKESDVVEEQDVETVNEPDKNELKKNSEHKVNDTTVVKHNESEEIIESDEQYTNDNIDEKTDDEQKHEEEKSNEDIEEDKNKENGKEEINEDSDEEKSTEKYDEEKDTEKHKYDNSTEKYEEEKDAKSHEEKSNENPEENSKENPEENSKENPEEKNNEKYEEEESTDKNGEEKDNDNVHHEEQDEIIESSNGNNHQINDNRNTKHETENTEHEHENSTHRSIVHEHPTKVQERNMIRDYSNPNIVDIMSNSNDVFSKSQIDEESEDDDDVQVQGELHPDSNISSKDSTEVNTLGGAKRHNTEVSSGIATDDGQYSQNCLIEGIINGDAEQDTQDASITQKDETVHGDIPDIENEIDPEVAELINTANMEMLATLVLNGEGSRLVGRRSYNVELQAFLDNVPMYMQKINKVHMAAREGSIRDLQAALDRRKFAIARDPISPNGATPLHVATIFGKTNIMKYLGGRFPETLSAVDFEGRTALHYAAVLPDNGHYYNLLQQLGANVKDLDDNGKSAEEYYKDPSLLPYTQLFAEYGLSEEAVQNMFSDKGSTNAANSRIGTPVFKTDEGRYLAKSLGDPLIKGLTEVANVKPKDPVAFLASFLHNFPEHEKPRLGTQESKAALIRERPDVENEVPPPAVAMAAAAAQPQVSRSAARTATRPHRHIDVVTVDSQVEASPDAPEAASSSVDRDEHGQSMLHFAAARKHTNNALFQLIQESNISLGYRDELYRTARDVSIQANISENTAQIDRFVLHLAARGNTREIMELLLEGYDHILDVVDDEDVPITEVIAQRGNTEMSNLLASIPAFEESRESLHSAIRRDDLATAESILSSEGGRTLARAHNTFSRTALHIAVLAQHEDVVAYLVQAFPELLKIGDNLERTPLHYAMGVEKMESLSRLLIRAGAKRVLKDLKGRQPTYYFMNKSDILRLKEEEEMYL